MLEHIKNEKLRNKMYRKSQKKLKELLFLLSFQVGPNGLVVRLG